jgi:hypothetical protein
MAYGLVGYGFATVQVLIAISSATFAKSSASLEGGDIDIWLENYITYLCSIAYTIC